MEEYKFLAVGELNSEAVPYSTFGSTAHCNEYVPRLIEQILGEGHEIEWEYGIHVASAKLMEREQTDGLIITLGHAAHNTLSGIRGDIIDAGHRGLWVPVFDAHLYGGSNNSKIEGEFSDWLKREFVLPKQRAKEIAQHFRNEKRDVD